MAILIFWSKRRVNEEKTVNKRFLRSARAKQGVSEATKVARETTMLASRRRTHGARQYIRSGGGIFAMANILTLAAYERARRALRGECEPNSRAGKMRTNISNEPSANIVKMREVGSRPCRLRQNKKRPSKTVFLVEAAGKRSKNN